MPFVMWEDGVCGYCGYKETEKDPDDGILLAYHLVCPRCYRDGCEECMPLGRGCICPDCEDAVEEE